MDDAGFLAGSASSGYDNSLADSRFLELQEELRSVVFTGLSSLSPNGNYRSGEVRDTYRDAAATAAAAAGAATTAAAAEPVMQGGALDFSAISIPKWRLTGYLRNWITKCAPFLDKFDEDAHFQTEVPLLARSEPALLYAMLAFSARQMEREFSSSQNRYDSLELYQESIRHLAPGLQAKDPNTLVTACILAVFELMVGRSKDWRRHLEGCAALFAFFGVDGFSPGLGQAVFWCYARMELCSAIMSEGSETTILPLEKWVPSRYSARHAHTTPGAADDAVCELFRAHSKESPGVYASWAVYLCTKVCHVRFCQNRSAELGEPDRNDSRPMAERWTQLWRELEIWYDERPKALVPVIDAEAPSSQVFPIVFFSHYAAISSNQLYHTACMLMLEMRPSMTSLASSPRSSVIWHARRVCGISCSNSHNGSWVNSIQPLYVAGAFFTHLTERVKIAKLLKTIDRVTGWGALWRIKDLEAEWGFEEGELLNAI